MSKPIIPEVLQKDIRQSKDNKTLNIKLQKIENRQPYNKYDNKQTITHNITTINEHKGFIRFIFDIVTFPIVLVYKSLKYVIIKADFNGNYKEYKERNDSIKRRKKLLKKAYKISRYDDEVF